MNHTILIKNQYTVCVIESVLYIIDEVTNICRFNDELVWTLFIA